MLMFCLITFAVEKVQPILPTLVTFTLKSHPDISVKVCKLKGLLYQVRHVEYCSISFIFVSSLAYVKKSMQTSLSFVPSSACESCGISHILVFSEFVTKALSVLDERIKSLDLLPLGLCE